MAATVPAGASAPAMRLRDQWWLRELAALSVLVVAYYVAGRVGLLLATASEIASPVWPPTGVAIAALLLRGVRMWPGVFVGALLVELTTVDAFSALALATGNTLEAVVAATLVLRLAGGARAFERPSDVLRYAVLTVAACAVGASVGVTTLFAGGFTSLDAIPLTWITWWLGDAAGALVVGPLLVLWASPTRTAARWNERAWLAAGTVLTLGIVFGTDPAVQPLAFLLVPLVVWSAVRLDARDTAALSALLSTVAIVATLARRGPFLLDHPQESLLVQQAFMGVTGFVGLVLAALVAQLHEATERLEDRVKERTASLAHAVDQLNESQRMAHVGSWELDLRTGRISWSDELYRIFGLDPATYSPTLEDYQARVHLADRAALAETLEKAMRDVEPFESEHRIIRADGAIRVIYGVGEILTDANGRAARLTGTVQDVTAQREAEAERVAHVAREREVERLRETAALRAHLLSAISHELKTPLTPLKLQLYMLKEGQLGPITDRQARAVDVLDRNLQRLGTLVDQTVEVARSQAGRMRLDRRTIDAASLLREVHDTYGEAAAMNGIALEMETEDALELDGDAARLMQVLVNLVSNALKFTPHGGRIHLSGRRINGAIEIRVADTGAGIRSEDIGRLFQPFVQLRAGRAVGGTGLGLFISRGIVEAHGGTVEAHSEGEGRGTTFLVRLPAATPPAPRDPAPTADRTPA